MATDKQIEKTSPKVRGVFELPANSNIWWIQYFARGRRHREKIGAKSMAVAMYHQRKTEIRLGLFVAPLLRRTGPLTFADIVDDALEYSKLHHTQGYQHVADGLLATLRDWFQGRLAKEITPQDIDRELAKLVALGRKPATVNRYRAVLSLTFSVAVNNKKLESNPLRHVPPLKEQNQRTRILEEREELILRGKIAELCPDKASEFDLALHTGMRRGEQYRLRWRDIDFGRSIITIPITKNGQPRHIPMNSVARSALLALKAQRVSSEFVIRSNPRVTRSRDNRKWFELAVEAAGIEDLRWHDLRHTFASRLIIAGVHLRAIQQLLGHKSLNMTLRYAHLNDTQLRSAIERLVDQEELPQAPGVAESPATPRKTWTN